MSRKKGPQKQAYICKSELTIMEVLWEQGETTAKQLYRILQDKTGWSKSTSYTVLERCIIKGFIERKEPHYLCCALISREDVHANVLNEFADLYFGGSKMELILSFLKHIALTSEELQNFQEMLKATRQPDNKME